MGLAKKKINDVKNEEQSQYCISYKMEASDVKRLNIREECCHVVPEDSVWLKEHKLVCGYKVV